MRKLKTLLCTAAAVAALTGASAAKDLNSIGISVGLLGNPFFVATIKGNPQLQKPVKAEAARGYAAQHHRQDTVRRRHLGRGGPGGQGNRQQNVTESIGCALSYFGLARHA